MPDGPPILPSAAGAAPPPLPETAAQPAGMKSPPLLHDDGAPVTEATSTTRPFVKFLRHLGRGARWVAEKTWRGAVVVSEHYWSLRKALGQRFGEYLSASQSSKDRPREIRLEGRDDRRHAHFIEGRWKVKLPDCCAVCAAATTTDWREERHEVPDATLRLWAPVAGLALGLALCCLSVWLLPLGIAAGFIAGYFLQRSVPVLARLRRCQEHAELGNAPHWFAHGEILVIRTGHAQVVERFYAENRAPAAVGSVSPVGAASAGAVRPIEDDSPIPLADAAYRTPAAPRASGGLPTREEATSAEDSLSLGGYQGFAAECFEIAFAELQDDREADTVPGGKSVYEAANAGRTEEALQAALALRERQPDYDFVYCWLGTLYQRQNKPREAEQALLTGLKVARRKWSLCDYLGDFHWSQHDLRSAVQWWLRSAVLQVFSRTMRDQGPFLYLAEVARALGMSAPMNHLHQHAQQIRRDVSLSPQACQQVALAVLAAMHKDDLKAVIERLDREYLASGEAAPTPPRYPTARKEVPAAAEGYALAPLENETPAPMAEHKNATVASAAAANSAYRLASESSESAATPAAAPKASSQPAAAASRESRLAACDTVAMICRLKGADFAAAARCDICAAQGEIPRGFVQMGTSANGFIGVHGWWIVSHQRLQELPELMDRGTRHFSRRTGDKSAATREKWITRMEKDWGQSNWLLCPECASLAAPDPAEWEPAKHVAHSDDETPRDRKPRTAASTCIALVMAIVLGAVFYWIGDSLSQFVAGFQADADGKNYPRWIGPTLGGLVALLVILGYFGSTTAAPTPRDDRTSDELPPPESIAAADLMPAAPRGVLVMSQFAKDLRCQNCGKSHGSTRWPQHGDMVPFYYQKEPGRHNLRVDCPHCHQAWYVVWDDNPGPMGRVMGV